LIWCFIFIFELINNILCFIYSRNIVECNSYPQPTLIHLTDLLVVSNQRANSNSLADWVGVAWEIAGAELGSEAGVHVLRPSGSRKALQKALLALVSIERATFQTKPLMRVGMKEAKRNTPVAV